MGASVTRWTEKDLDLFKSRRQRGTAPPPAKEFDLHVILADVLKRWCLPDWRYTHLPMGEYRTPATAGRLKRMGVTPGWPDYLFIHKDGRVCWLELKRKGNDATEVQEALAVFLQGAGHFYICTDSFETALNFLRHHQIVPSGVRTLTNKDHAPCATPEERRIEER